MDILIWCARIESVQTIQLVPYWNPHIDEKLFPSQIAENVAVILHNILHNSRQYNAANVVVDSIGTKAKSNIMYS